MALVEESTVVWVTSPSSPGLKTRIETAMLQAEHDWVSDEVEAGPQFQTQFHVHVGDDEAGAVELVPTEPSVQFHCQFHTQLSDGSDPVSGKTLV